jgi:hypothetical protein
MEGEARPLPEEGRFSDEAAIRHQVAAAIDVGGIAEQPSEGA